MPQKQMPFNQGAEVSGWCLSDIDHEFLNCCRKRWVLISAKKPRGNPRLLGARFRVCVCHVSSGRNILAYDFSVNSAFLIFFNL